MTSRYCIHSGRGPDATIGDNTPPIGSPVWRESTTHGPLMLDEVRRVRERRASADSPAVPVYLVMGGVSLLLSVVGLCPDVTAEPLLTAGLWATIWLVALAASALIAADAVLLALAICGWGLAPAVPDVEGRLDVRA